MPVQTLKIRFLGVSVLDDTEWGAGEWHLHASVNAQPVGNASKEHRVHSGDFILLDSPEWTRVVDVSGHAAGDKIEIKFHVIEEDVFSDDNLGAVKATLRFPYDDPAKFIFLESPKLPGGWFSDDYRCYNVMILAKHNDEVASTTPTGPTRIPVTRGARGSVTFNSVAGERFTPRVDIHPVIPLPQPPSHTPRPVHIPSGMAAAVLTPAGQVGAMPSAPTLNALPNPCVIPVLETTDPDFANRVSNLAITAYQPGNLDPSKFFWRVADGPASIVGANTGLTIQARGIRSGRAEDQMAVFEVRWENAEGPVLARYRAWVGKLGTLPYRINIIDGRVPVGSPAGTNPTYHTSAVLSPATANSILQVARAIVFQAGILLVPDSDTTTYEGATIASAPNATFVVTAANDQHTNQVDLNIISSSTRYNFRPGVMNFAIVFSTKQGIAAAVERNGIEGSPDSGKSLANDYTYTYNGSGVEKTLGGSPSSSWIKPAGVGGDGFAVTQKLTTISPTDRVHQARKLDKAFVTSRKAVDASFTTAKMGELYACVVPADWIPGTHYAWRCGINFAHELGHVLGLAHRGSGGNSTGPSADSMDFKNSAGATRGHPWTENVMCYGYANGVTPPSHDIDEIQASVIRRHPAIRY